MARFESVDEHSNAGVDEFFGGFCFALLVTNI